MVKVDITFTPAKEGTAELPRVGMRMRFPAEFGNINYLGRGPEENYGDRNHGTFLDIYKTTAAQMYYPYVRPQENGHHTDTQWIEILNKEGRRSEEHTSELQSRQYLVCRLL